MKTTTALCLLPALLSVSAVADDVPITPKVDSVGLFKNGLCVVHASFDAKEPGTFVWSDPPRCVHGTFMVETGDVSLSSRMRMVEETPEREQPTGVLQADLAGQNVKIRLRGANGAADTEISGRVWQIPTGRSIPAQGSNSMAVETVDSRYGYWGGGAWNPGLRPATAPQSVGSYLVVEGDQKRVYVDVSQIASVEVTGAVANRKRIVEKPQMVFHAAKPGVIKVAYLARGATWVPSYQIDLSDPKNARLKQTALIRNELAPWKDARIELISGFPNIRFSHVDSPLYPGTTLASFFQDASRDPSSPSAITSNMLTQNVAYNGFRQQEGPSDFPIEGSASEDLHFEDIGSRDVELGETLSLEIANASAPYERVVEWTAKDRRSDRGDYQRNDPQEQDDTWDAVLLQNPLKFPMTTAAASFTEEGRFRGQSMSTWTNPGQRACLRITKALTVQCKRQEVEEPGKREDIVIAGERYYRTNVKGTLTLRNFRSEQATVLSHAQFSGELLNADEKPSDTLRTDGVISVNPRHELEWKISVAPGSEKVLTYRYSVLVRY